MKVFFDCEFTRLKQDTQLISVGLVAETGQEFYGVCSNFRRDLASNWVKIHVLPNLHCVTDVNGPHLIKPSWQITARLREWLMQFKTVEIWGDVPAYDWVLLCELFGGAPDLPTNVSYICRDLATLLESKGLAPDLDRAQYGKLEGKPHCAIWDARVIKACYEKANQKEAPIKAKS